MIASAQDRIDKILRLLSYMDLNDNLQFSRSESDSPMPNAIRTPHPNTSSTSQRLSWQVLGQFNSSVEQRQPWDWWQPDSIFALTWLLPLYQPTLHCINAVDPGTGALRFEVAHTASFLLKKLGSPLDAPRMVYLRSPRPLPHLQRDWNILD